MKNVWLIILNEISHVLNLQHDDELSDSIKGENIFIFKRNIQIEESIIYEKISTESNYLIITDAQGKNFWWMTRYKSIAYILRNFFLSFQ